MVILFGGGGGIFSMQSTKVQIPSVIIKKLEKLRTANEKLRDSGYYWHHVAKDLVKDFYSKPKLAKFKFWK